MLKKILLALMFVITAITSVTHAEDDMKTAASKAYVDTKIETKQLKIPAAGQPNVDAGETVMTYTSAGNGQIGERALYSDISNYDATTDGDKLITASALNATFTNLPTTPTTKLECANSPACTLWTIVDQTAYARGLPDGYIQRQYIYMMDNSYLVPDIIPESDWHIEMDFQTTSVSTTDVRTYFGGRYDGSPAGAGLRLAHTAGRKVVLYGFDTNNAYAGSTYNMANNTRYKYVYNNGSASLSTGGTVVDSTTFTPNDTTTSAVGINSYRGQSGNFSSITEGIYLYSFKAWNGQGELVMNLVPVIQQGTVPVVGFYDMVSGTFKTATAGTFAAGPEVN